MTQFHTSWSTAIVGLGLLSATACSNEASRSAASAGQGQGGSAADGGSASLDEGGSAGSAAGGATSSSGAAGAVADTAGTAGQAGSGGSADDQAPAAGTSSDDDVDDDPGDDGDDDTFSNDDDDDDATADDDTGDDDAELDPPDAGDDVAQPSCDASTAPAVGALGLATAFTSPQLQGVSYATQPPGSDDWYLVEQRGRIMVVSDGVLRDTPFYDVQEEIDVDPVYDERGLHSIAFAPDYAESGLFYIVLTPTKGERQHRDLFLEHRRSEADPYVADMTVMRELLNLEGIASSGLLDNVHNAYLARFGPDGMLYLGMGDGGGGCNDNPGFEDLPQDIRSPVGKLLRFDLSQPEPWGALDNPFAEDGDPRVLHYGLRNPFRFSWDLEGGNLYIGDVGQDTHEEINVVPTNAAGLNFGWAGFEGDEATCNGRALASGSEEPVPPVFFTTHGGNSPGGACTPSAFCDYSAIVGGHVYRGKRIATLVGTYLFGDWAGNNMAALVHCDGATSDITVIDYVRDLNVPSNGYLVKTDDSVPDVQSITAIVEDHDRELYLVANGNALLSLVPAP